MDENISYIKILHTNKIIDSSFDGHKEYTLEYEHINNKQMDKRKMKTNKKVQRSMRRRGESRSRLSNIKTNKQNEKHEVKEAVEAKQKEHEYKNSD